MDRSLGRRHPRILSSCPGRHPNTNPLRYQRTKRQGQDQWPQAGRGQPWPLLDKGAYWPSTWALPLPPCFRGSYRQEHGACWVTHGKSGPRQPHSGGLPCHCHLRPCDQPHSLCQGARRARWPSKGAGGAAWAQWGH